MTSDQTGNVAPPPSATRLRARDTLAMVLGRDVVGARDDPGTAGSGPESAEGALLPLGLRLFLLSFLMLFVELALIRWLGALVLYLSYFSNFVLLGSFLGIGIGFLRARSRVNLFPWAPVALALLIIFVRLFPVQVDRGRPGGPFGAGTFHATGPPTWVTLPCVFLAVAAVMATIGEGVARTFVRFRPLDAYRLDIAGSIAGIAAFTLLAFLDAKPVVWAVIVALILLLLYGRRARPGPGSRGPGRGRDPLVGIGDVHRHLVALLPHLVREGGGRVPHRRERDPASGHRPGQGDGQDLLDTVHARPRRPAE